ncbi:MAG TPA: carboxypeptidase-like regulatory domain-containing protein [Vicinamibacteria bacterium]|nr:carboxypeptidase-like regulatory domain-containing protein [Vicinamibacteria bacterium]
MISLSSHRSLLAAGSALALAACGFSPTAPFSGFDGQGTSLTGSFDTTVGARDGGRSTAATFEGLSVSVAERPSLSTTVSSDGRFALAGLPSGAWSLVFSRSGQNVGEIRFTSVRQNQGITIVVGQTPDGEVVLLSEKRDHVSFEGECPRGAGFWCQNQGGKNPNLSDDEFGKFAKEAAELLKDVPALDTLEEIAAAVCNTGDQLLRQLATLALNLAAGTLTRETILTGETYGTVGEAFDAAVNEAKTPSLSREERNALKDVLERINESENTGVCPDGEDDDDADGDDGAPTSGKMTICHIPPGNPGAKHTLEVDASAWPAHRAHGDTIGACS